MSNIPNIVPVTDLRQDAAAAIRRVQKSQDPLFITQRGRAAAVLVSIESYERASHEREILMLLARGEQEIAAGKSFDLDSVLNEADRILKS